MAELLKESKNEVFLVSESASEKNQLPELFQKWLSNHLSAGTRSIYASSLREFGRFLSERNFRFSHPKDIKPNHIINYRDWLISEDNSNKTVNRKLSALSSLFKELRHEQVIPLNPAESVRRPPSDIKKVRTSFSDSEIKRLLSLYDEDTRQGLQNKALLSFLAYTGQRISTVLNLRVKDVQVIDGLTVLSLKVKGGKLRRLPIGLEPSRLMAKVLKEKKSTDDYLFSPLRGKKKGENKAISRESVHGLIKRSLLRIKVNPNKSAHGFRRSVLTKLLNTEGISAEQVREEVSFHSSLDTLAIYKMKTEKKMVENPILTVVYPK